jgi:glycosyltransferase involved in cell wall biosynthesis
MQVSAIIPAFNEEKTIASTVMALRSIGGIDEIIVVDDGSEDRTAELARKAGAIIFSLAENCGKGQALEVGCAVSLGEILLLLDADLGETAKEAVVLLKPLMENEADMSVAVFSLSDGKGGFGLVQGLSRWAISRSGGPRLAQPLSGQRALPRHIWQKIGFKGGFGVETALSMGIHRLGYHMVEVPVAMSHRRTSRDWRGMVHRGRQFVHVLLTIVRHWRWLI